MKIKFLFIAIVAIVIAGCNNDNMLQVLDNSNESNIVDDGHEHELSASQYTVYTDKFELFAEADPFILDEKAKVLAHFSNLPDFGPLTKGAVKISLNIGGAESHQLVENPIRPGIYQFEIKPRKSGVGTMKFEIQSDGGSYLVEVKDVVVYPDHHSAEQAPEPDQSDVNTIIFTKEQSWKIEFDTQLPTLEPMGQIIKTTAQIQSTPQDEVIITSGLSGIIRLLDNGILEGKKVTEGDLLFTISGEELIDNNSEVFFMESKLNYELAHSEYIRSQELSKDKIISEKELHIAKNKYENAKVKYEKLTESYNISGQSIISPVNGFIKQLLAVNGQYVEVGDAIVSISRNESLFLHADVQQKYHSVLDDIVSANIKTLYDSHVYTLEGLNGKIISYGRTTNNHNFLIPINLEINYIKGFMPGSFVELYLKTITNTNALTIPNSALLENQGNFFVMVQVTPEKFEMREIKIGSTDGLKVEVLKGLISNERIVTKGATLIKLARSSGGLDAHSGHVH